MSHDFTAPAARDGRLDEDLIGDPDLDGLGDDVEEGSDLDDLRQELTAKVAETVTLAVEGRPGYSVTYRVDFTARDVESIRKRAKDRKFTDGIDGIKFAALLLAFACRGITRKAGDLGAALGVDGPVTFTTRELQGLIGTHDANSTVRAFYGLEGHVEGSAKRLLVEAGWGDEADLADPTE